MASVEKRFCTFPKVLNIISTEETLMSLIVSDVFRLINSWALRVLTETKFGLNLTLTLIYRIIIELSAWRRHKEVEHPFLQKMKKKTQFMFKSAKNKLALVGTQGLRVKYTIRLVSRGIYSHILYNGAWDVNLLYFRDFSHKFYHFFSYIFVQNFSFELMNNSLWWWNFTSSIVRRRYYHSANYASFTILVTLSCKSQLKVIAYNL